MMRSRLPLNILVLWAAITIFPFVGVLAQQNSNIIHYSTEDGLSHDGVLCITKDKEGFMWFGTFDGINRFDGHNFVVYKSKPGDTSNLRNNKIRSLVEDRSGYLWIKTYDSKVYRFDKKNEQFLPISDGVYKYLFTDKAVVDKIVPDADNGVWLVTENHGLFYASNDVSGAVKIRQYAKNKYQKASLSGNVVQFLERDQKGRIWAGSEGGLNCLQRNRNNIYEVVQFKKELTKLLSSYSFTCFARDSKSLFFGTRTGQLLIDDLSKDVFRTKTLIPGTPLNAICSAKTGLLYVSTAGKGLITLDQGSDKISRSGMTGSDTFFSLYEDKGGLIWIEPLKDGIIKYDPRNGKYKYFIQQKDFNSSSRDYQVITDANGTIWTTMKGGGFGYYDPMADDMIYFYDKPGSADQKFSNILTSLFIDQTGVLWLSAKDGGINKVVPVTGKFDYQRLVKQPHVRSENDVRAMMKDAQGRLWICTKDGRVYVYDQGKAIAVFGNASSKLGSVYTIKEDRKGNVWLGTKGDGLFKATPRDKSRRSYVLRNYKNDVADNNSLSSNLVYSVIEDRKGRIWVGTLGGGINLFTQFGGKEGFMNCSNTFHNYPFSWAKVIRHLCEDSQGRIWIGTSNGLLIFNPDQKVNGSYQFNAYQKIRGDRSSLGNNCVQYIYQDKSGQMWVGTFGGGLNKVIAGKGSSMSFDIFTTEQGLSNDVILSITSDQQHNIWVATERGLSKFNPRSKTFKNYDSFDGLPKAGFSEATCFAAADGKLYFGCTDGYLSFNPLTIANKKTSAKMALTRLQLYYKDIVPGAEGSPLKYAINETQILTLNDDQNVISLDYAVLDYRGDNKVTYAYRLEGFDKSWHLVNDQRKATYTNIPPGTYTFKVRATSDELFNTIPEKTLRIIVKPPYYLTNLAYLIYFVLAIGIAILARRIIITMIRLRNKVVIEQKLTEVKLSFFTNISHELRTPLSLIVSPLQEISRIEDLSAKGQEYLRVIDRNAKRMIRFINQLLDFRKIQSDKMQLNIGEMDFCALIKDIGSHFTGMAAEKDITFEINCDQQQVVLWADEEKIDIIVYNLLSNAFKFTPPHKNITLAVCCLAASNEIELRVIDEGHGVPADKLEDIFDIYYEGNFDGEHHLKGTGIGLALARGLALSHHGKLWAETNSSGGLTFVLRLKGGSAHFSPTQFGTSRNIVVDDSFQTELSDENRILPIRHLHDLNTPQILIVEDNPDLRSFLALKLDGLYRVESANDGVEGLAMAKALLPDLIISDVMMPHMDGIAMLEQLRSDLHTSHIPVVLLTAKSSIESQLEGLKYGADIYLTKPFHTDFLLTSIANLITSRKKLFDRLSGMAEKKVLNLEPGEVVITSKDEAFLKEMIKIVEEGMKDPEFNIDDAAAAIGMGRTTFYKKLKSLSSLSPVEFVRSMRLKRSKQLLDSGSYTVSEAGYLSGFNSLPYFSTCFKEKYEMAPSTYLKNSKAEGRLSKIPSE